MYLYRIFVIVYSYDIGGVFVCVILRSELLEKLSVMGYTDIETVDSNVDDGTVLEAIRNGKKLVVDFAEDTLLSGVSECVADEGGSVVSVEDITGNLLPCFSICGDSLYLKGGEPLVISGVSLTGKESLMEFNVLGSGLTGICLTDFSGASGKIADYVFFV